MIEVELPDGTIAEFPEGTPNEVISSVLQKQFGAPKADMSFMGRLKDNVVGVDDGVMSLGEKAATALNMGGEGLTLGVVGDEAAARADALVGRGSYDERLDKYRGGERQFSEENPVAAMASQVIPSLAVPGLGIARTAGLLGKSITGAATGSAGPDFLATWKATRATAKTQRSMPQNGAGLWAFSALLLGGTSPTKSMTFGQSRNQAGRENCPVS